MIRDIRLQHFRSYDDARFELDPGVTVIVGPNGSGKTNLLEAVLFLGRGSSYRAKDTELIQFGADWARLDAHADDGQLRTVKLMAEPASKLFEIHGQHLTRLHPSRTLPVVLFEPNHLLLLHGAPDLRRIFLDDLIEQSDPGFGPIRRHYRRVLAQRNRLLKTQPKDIREQLFVWNIRLSELGGQIASQRRRLLDRFNAAVPALYKHLAGRDNHIELLYQSRFPAEVYESQLLHKLEHSTELDIARGFTAYGPHRDDLLVLLDGHPMSEAASRGETRTLLLALKILELEWLEATHATPPILLLDDVFSELDAQRRQVLTQYVEPYQTLITTTNADAIADYLQRPHSTITTTLTTTG